MTRTKSTSTSSKPSWVRFFPSDYIAGTARMPRMVRSMYDDIMIHNFDKNRALMPAEAMLVFGDVDPATGEQIIENLIEAGKVQQDENGGLFINRAMTEAGWSWAQWEAKSAGGRKGGAKGKKTASAEDIVKGDDAPKAAVNGKKEKTATITPLKSDQTLRQYSHNHNHNHIESEATASASGGGGGNDDIDDSEDKGLVGRAIKAQEEDLIASHMTLIPPAWNEMAIRNGLNEVSSVSDKRSELIRQVIGEFGLDKTLEVIKSIAESDFLLGDNTKMGPVKFDWAMRNFGKIADRDYHDEKPPEPTPAPKPEPVRELDCEPSSAKAVRAALIEKLGEDKFYYKFRGIEFYQSGFNLVVAAVSSGIAQDLVIVQRSTLEEVASLCGFEGITHSSISTARKEQQQLDTLEK